MPAAVPVDCLWHTDASPHSQLFPGSTSALRHPRPAAVAKLALQPGVLMLEPAEFDRRWHAGAERAVKMISYRDSAAHIQAASAAVGELLQAADGVPGALQQEYAEQGAALVQRSAPLAGASPASLHSNWAALHSLGLAEREVAAAVQQQPAILTTNWEGEAKQLLAAWLQRELSLSLAHFIRRHAGYATNGVGRLALRAAYLQQHQPAVWEETRSRGAGPLLSLLTDNRSFFPKASCTQAELDAFEREWLQTPDGRRFGRKASRKQRTPAELARASAASP